MTHLELSDDERELTRILRGLRERNELEPILKLVRAIGLAERAVLLKLVKQKTLKTGDEWADFQRAQGGVDAVEDVLRQMIAFAAPAPADEPPIAARRRERISARAARDAARTR